MVVHDAVTDSIRTLLVRLASVVYLYVYTFHRLRNDVLTLSCDLEQSFGTTLYMYWVVPKRDVHPGIPGEGLYRDPHDRGADQSRLLLHLRVVLPRVRLRRLRPTLPQSTSWDVPRSDEVWSGMWGCNQADMLLHLQGLRLLQLPRRLFLHAPVLCTDRAARDPGMSGYGKMMLKTSILTLSERCP